MSTSGWLQSGWAREPVPADAMPRVETRRALTNIPAPCLIRNAFRPLWRWFFSFKCFGSKPRSFRVPTLRSDSGGAAKGGQRQGGAKGFKRLQKGSTEIIRAAFHFSALGGELWRTLPYLAEGGSGRRWVSRRARRRRALKDQWGDLEDGNVRSSTPCPPRVRNPN